MQISPGVECEQELALYQQQVGPFTQPSVRANAKTMEPSQWWDTYGKHLPLLCSYAKCILAQPAAASAAERNWSIYGLIKSDRRTRLRPVVADKLVYCHEALALHAKLQDAAYRPEPEPWEEDSDEDDEVEVRIPKDGKQLKVMLEKQVLLQKHQKQAVHQYLDQQNKHRLIN